MEFDQKKFVMELYEQVGARALARMREIKKHLRAAGYTVYHVEPYRKGKGFLVMWVRCHIAGCTKEQRAVVRSTVRELVPETIEIVAREANRYSPYGIGSYMSFLVDLDQPRVK